MALIKCPECGREKVSDQAKACPECGFPIGSIASNKVKRSNTNSLDSIRIIGPYVQCHRIDREAKFVNPAQSWAGINGFIRVEDGLFGVTGSKFVRTGWKPFEGKEVEDEEGAKVFGSLEELTKVRFPQIGIADVHIQQAIYRVKVEKQETSLSDLEGRELEEANRLLKQFFQQLQSAIGRTICQTEVPKPAISAPLLGPKVNVTGPNGWTDMHKGFISFENGTLYLNRGKSDEYRIASKSEVIKAKSSASAVYDVIVGQNQRYRITSATRFFRTDQDLKKFFKEVFPLLKGKTAMAHADPEPSGWLPKPPPIDSRRSK